MTINPTQPPVLPIDVFQVGRPLVLVTGAESFLGRAVIDELRRSHVPSRALVSGKAAPNALTTVRGDIRTGVGLDLALNGVGAVIHCASDTKHPDAVDVAGTRCLVDALDAWAPRAHLVVPSRIGVWENPHPYFRARADVENLAQARGENTSIVRSTLAHHQVHALLNGWGGRLRGGTQEISVAPIDPVWLAKKLVDVALLRDHLPMPHELAGPETLTLRELATLTDHIERGSRRFGLALATRAASLQAMTRGVHLPGPQAQRGGRTYSQWLASRV